MKKISFKKAFAALLALVTVLLLFPALVPAMASGGAGWLILLQTYGGGKNQSGTPVSHSFVEVYNPTDAPVDLNGWKVVYHDDRDPAAPPLFLPCRARPSSFFLRLGLHRVRPAPA